MKRILLLLLFLTALVGTASAYGLYLNCTNSIQAGLPLRCSVDSTFPPGTTFNLALYQSQYTATLIRTQPVTIQSDHNTQYIIFDTSGLPGGIYKAELQFTGADAPRMSSDSIIDQVITIVDRSGDLTITSPAVQDPSEALRIEGEIAHEGNGGVELEVRGPDGRIFGPQWIQTKDNLKNGAGVFTQKVPSTTPGDYSVDFSDTQGFIGTKTFTVAGPTTQPTAVVTTAPPVTKTTKPVTTIPTPWPTTTQSPVSPFPAVAGLALAGIAVTVIGRR